MSENTINVYEGLFLFPQAAGSNLGEAADHVQDLLSKSGAEVLSFSKWEERRLAYEIKGHKRGVFFLGYFKLPGTEMAELDRRCLLSEDLLRFMITRADQMTLEEIQEAEGRSALQEEIAARADQAEAGTSEVTVRSSTRADRESSPDTEDKAPSPEAAPAPEAKPASETEPAAEAKPAPEAEAASEAEAAPASDEAQASEEAPAATED